MICHSFTATLPVSGCASCSIPMARPNPSYKIYFRRSPVGKPRPLSCMGHAIVSFPFPRQRCCAITCKGLPNPTASSYFQSTAIGYPCARSKARRFSFSKRMAATLAELPILDLFKQLFGLLFVFSVVGELVWQNRYRPEQRAGSLPFLPDNVSTRQLQARDNH